jgi:hypothetical protein
MALVLMHVQMFLLGAPDPSSREIFLGSRQWCNLQRLLIQIRCVCRQTPVVELMTDRLISRIGIALARRRIQQVQHHAIDYLTDLRAMVAHFGGLPMPGVVPLFGEERVDAWAVAQTVRQIQDGDAEGSVMDIEEVGLEDEGTEEGPDGDEI